MIIIAEVNITYEGRNITREISPYITAFTFTDNSGGNADDISLTIEDRNSLWLNDWMPAKGDTISANVISSGKELSCGRFEVDEISYSIPPHTLSIKAVSCALKQPLTYENHNQTWDDTTLSAIASDIATKAGLTLFYDADDYELERREQSHIPDLPFLEALCGSFGLNVKVSDGKLIIYSQEDYSGHDSATEIHPNDKRLISVKFTSKSAKIFRRAKVKYHHPVKNETYEAEYDDPDEEGSERELEIYERVDSQQQAEQVAREALKGNNSKEITASLQLIGSIDFMAGVNITLADFGMFSGKYFVDKVTHNINSGGWTCDLSLKMGGDAKKSAKKRKASSRKKTSSGGGDIGYADPTDGY